MRGPRYFTFNGHSSQEFGIIVNSVDRPIQSEVRPKKLIIPGMDGAWDFGNGVRNNTYEETVVQINCTLVDPLDNLSIGRSIAAWLGKKDKLIISDEPDRYYVGRVYDKILQAIKDAVGTFSIPFIVEPFAYSTSKTTDAILLGSNIPIGSVVTIGNAANYKINLTAPGSININNFGSRDIRPAININGSFTNITLSCNGKTISYSSAISSKLLIIDGLNYSATIDGVNKLTELTGDVNDFLTLIPGMNAVSITGTNLNCSVQFEFRPRFY